MGSKFPQYEQKSYVTVAKVFVLSIFFAAHSLIQNLDPPIDRSSVCQTELDYACDRVPIERYRANALR